MNGYFNVWLSDRKSECDIAIISLGYLIPLQVYLLSVRIYQRLLSASSTHLDIHLRACGSGLLFGKHTNAQTGVLWSGGVQHAVCFHYTDCST